jgi:RNA polymerase sigma-70 factor (ECF subfamily)
VEAEEFRTLLQQVRLGDAEAATRLVLEYEPAIRRYVRVRLTDAHLRQVLDTMDVCQSVLGNFFIRVAAGQFDLEQPEQLLRLLATMARNRLLNHLRDQQAGCRDNRRQMPGPDEALAQATDPAAGPSRIAAGREMLERLQQVLAPADRAVLQRRLQGQDWATIAAELGGTAEGLRKRMSRALDRAARTLGLDELGPP